jgi:heme A synthase
MPANPNSSAWGDQPFAGSRSVSNNDAAQAAGMMMRSGLVPSWMAPLTPEQAKRAYRRDQAHRIFWVLCFGFLGIMMTIAALTLLLSHPVNALVGLGVSLLVLGLAVWQYRKFARWQKTDPVDYIRAVLPNRGVR